MPDNLHKHDRQRALMQVLTARPLASQRELVTALRERGFRTTQASMSRDIRELGLVKVAGLYRRVEDLGTDRTSDLHNDPSFALITGFEPVGANLIVVRTATGAANSVGAALDRKRIPQIVGTLAGDDTVFVAVRSRSDQGRVIALLRRVSAPRP